MFLSVASNCMNQNTSKERDAETGLDYFGARYYSGAQGRFLSVDPLMASADSIEPQSWNRYSYVSNNPLRFVDDEGKIKRDTEGNPVFAASGSPMSLPHETGPSAVMQPGYLFADNGDPIVAFRNESDDLRFNADCHGTTFADGLYWINNDQVRTLLEGDGYKDLKSKDDAQEGDVAIYTEEGFVKHSATVTKVEDGKASEVWGVGGIAGYAEITSATPGSEGAWANPNAKVEYWRKPDKKKRDNKGKSTSAIQGKAEEKKNEELE
jgi:RHS repeat-associated protein